MDQTNSTQTTVFQGTGRRKTSTARVRILAGSGKFMVNEKSLDDFFGGLERHKKTAVKPIEFLPANTNYDFNITVEGGGITGQAGAIRHGLANAILKIDASLKSTLRKEGLLTRDSRMVERKKPGRPKARKRFQFSKR